ncbi:PREDICTED: uncharacterized protein LOC109185789 [Ipomoea nil]|uniref:uncharacterized protein LOC109185789 n=1 Tax=Ipomoea nil TaxID=35883 RepID=UPI00090187C5|nr:PREDICTED: uncharacterized protein LOC109185789 [Ipomoea nil]
MPHNFFSLKCISLRFLPSPAFTLLRLSAYALGYYGTPPNDPTVHRPRIFWFFALSSSACKFVLQINYFAISGPECQKFMPKMKKVVLKMKTELLKVAQCTQKIFSVDSSFPLLTKYREPEK